MSGVVSRSPELRTVRYDPVNAVLEVEFPNAGVFQFFGIPLAMYEALLAAPSREEYFEKYIRHRFRFRRLITI